MYKFHNYDHANQYLANSIVRGPEPGQLSYIFSVGPGNQVYYLPQIHYFYHALHQKGEIREAHLSQFNWQNLTSRFVNIPKWMTGHKDSFAKLVRLPKRQWCFGLSHNNIYLDGIYGEIHTENLALYSPSLTDAMNEKYPPYKKGVASALSKNWGVDDKDNVYFFSSKAAVGKIKNGNIKPKQSFLIDHLRQELPNYVD